MKIMTSNLFMRRLLAAMALCIAAALGAQAQGVARWLQVEHDFGVFPEERDTVSCSFRVVNAGDSAMVITRVQTTCGCTAARYSRQPLQPGDTGVVAVTYEVRHIPGQFQKKIFVYTSGTPRRSTLTITGRVIGSAATVRERYPVAVGPVRLSAATLPLGQVLRDKGTVGYLRGYNTAPHTMLVSLIGVPQDRLSVQAVPDTVPPGGLFVLSVYYQAAAAPLWGLNVDTVTVLARSLHLQAVSGPTDSATVQVTAQVMEDFSQLTQAQRRAAPSAELSDVKVDFGDVPPGAVVTRTLTVANHGRSPLQLRRLFVPQGEGVTAVAGATTVKPGKAVPITLTLHSAQRTERVVDTWLTVITNDPCTPVQQVRLVGTLSAK